VEGAGPITIPAGALFTAADVQFMQGMIAHHGQAIHMSRLAATRGASPRLLRLAQKIDQSQAGEIVLMQEWLRANGPVAARRSAAGRHDDARHAHRRGAGAARGGARPRPSTAVPHPDDPPPRGRAPHGGRPARHPARRPRTSTCRCSPTTSRPTQTAEIGLMRQMLTRAVTPTWSRA
jgi:hypothetical protein